MLTDPQSVTISAVAYSLPRTSTGSNTASYADSTGVLSLTIAHTYAKRIRRAIKFVWSKIAADTLNPTLNTKSSMSMTLVFDLPPTGFTLAEQQAVVAGVMTYLTASTNAKVTSVLGGES